jgi:hypothetical protein
MNWSELSDAEFSEKERELTRDARLTSYGGSPNQSPMSDADAAKIEAELKAADKTRAEENDAYRSATYARASETSLYDELRAADQENERARLMQVVRERACSSGVRMIEDSEQVRDVLFNPTSRLSEEARITRAVNVMREMSTKKT